MGDPLLFKSAEFSDICWIFECPLIVIHLAIENCYCAEFKCVLWHDALVSHTAFEALLQAPKARPVKGILANSVQK